MARRRVADPVTVHSWEEADALLGQIAERQREVTRIELEMNQRIAVLKENAKAAVKVHQAEIAAGEKQLALFAAQHREDFGKGKSKPLTHGVIGWRQSTTVKLLRSVADTVAALLKTDTENVYGRPRRRWTSRRYASYPRWTGRPRASK